MRRSILDSVSRDELVAVVGASSFLSDVLAKYGLSRKGTGNYVTLRRRLDVLGIDYSHAVANYVKSKRSFGVRKPLTPLSAVLVDGSGYHRGALKRRLLKEGMLKETCDVCGCGPEWNGKFLGLELDHVNGKSNDNRLENLRLLCPNCHSQTATSSGRNRRKRNQKTCSKCSKPISWAAVTGFCKQCFLSADRPAGRKVVNRPSFDDLKTMTEDIGFEAVGRKFGVTGNAIRKWLQQMKNKSPVQ